MTQAEKDMEKIGDDLDALVAELQKSPPNQNSNQLAIAPTTQISTEQELESYINDSTQEANNTLLAVIKEYAQDIGDDSERAEAFASLVKANASLMKILSDQLKQKRDIEAKLTLQKLKEQGETVRDVLKGGKSVVGKRDDIFKEIFNSSKDVELSDDDIEELD